jgi:hypothetical protein
MAKDQRNKAKVIFQTGSTGFVSFFDPFYSVILSGIKEPQMNADERTINTFGQSQGYCAGVATPDPGEAPPMAEFNMI